MTKFRAIQTHTSKNGKHFVSVKGVEARNGPYKLQKKTKRYITGIDKNGDLWQFFFHQWQIILV